jgi:hypothetical protein
MSTIDERIVSMVFENAKFEAGVAKTMATLTKLDDGLKKIGQNNATASLDNIEKTANKVTLQGPLNALDKLRGRLFGSGKGAAEGMSQIEAAGNKVNSSSPSVRWTRSRPRPPTWALTLPTDSTRSSRRLIASCLRV